MATIYIFIVVVLTIFNEALYAQDVPWQEGALKSPLIFHIAFFATVQKFNVYKKHVHFLTISYFL